MNKAEYDAYLRGSVWKAKRQMALEHAMNACQLCNRSKNLHVADLTVLCANCHNDFHKRSNVAPSRAKEKARRKGPKPSTVASMPRVIEYLKRVPAKHNGISTGQIANALKLEKKHTRAVMRALVDEGSVDQASSNRWELPVGQALADAVDQMLTAPDRRRLSDEPA
jgi:hypothetical protein